MKKELELLLGKKFSEWCPINALEKKLNTI